jgi:hypothetical protein
MVVQVVMFAGGIPVERSFVARSCAEKKIKKKFQSGQKVPS